jgi:hypothetical protein
MSCDCGKKLLATIAVFTFKMVSGMVLCGGIFNWVYSLPPTNVWRPMTATGKRYYVGMLLVSLLFVVVYKIVIKAFDGMSVVKKGLLYGICVWAVGIVPGMISTYFFMTVNTTVVAYLTILGLVLTPIEGVIVAAILRSSDTSSECCIKKS